MAGKGKGKRLTDSERMEIIAKLEDPAGSISRANCAKEYGVTPAAISKLMKVSQTVKKRYSDAGTDNNSVRDKRQRGGFSKNVKFEDELYQWICSVRARKIPLLVAHVQQKAKLLAANHGMNEDFKASNGWYYRFCGRYGLSPASLHTGTGVLQTGTAEVGAETKTIKVEDAETTQKLGELRDKVAEVGAEFVYSVSEARLFYQLLPSQIRPTPMSDTNTAATGMIAGAAAAAVPGAVGMERNGAMPGAGKTARVLVLVCTNATGTHKIPLLVIGKEEAPACLAKLQPQLLRSMQPNDNDDAATAVCLNNVGGGVGMGTSYYSQREVWCDDRTFQHWCKKVFLPAVRQRTTRPVLLVAENPGGRIAAFQQENVSTMFLPFRTGSSVGEVQPVAAGTSANNVSSYVQLQPLHAAVIRDLKRRYKVELFQERLSFLEKPDDERFRLMQRAMKKPPGSAGMVFGRTPHLLDAMRLLHEAWAATPSALITSSWIKSNLGGSTSLSSSVTEVPELSDDVVVLELCSLMRNVAVVEDINSLGKELRQWLHVDDDSSERMQQELLYDIQQLLQEEELQANVKEPVQQHQQEILQQQEHLQQLQLQQQQNASTFMDTTSMPTSFDPNQPGSFVYRAADGRPTAVSQIDSSVVLREKRKAINFALHALAGAEEALDSADVVEFFGEDATNQAIESVSRAVRKLRRIQRGKQSALVAAAVNAAASSDGNDSTQSALAAHEYFYGSGGLGGIP